MHLLLPMFCNSPTPSTMKEVVKLKCSSILTISGFYLTIGMLQNLPVRFVSSGKRGFLLISIFKLFVQDHPSNHICSGRPLSGSLSILPTALSRWTQTCEVLEPDSTQYCLLSELAWFCLIFLNQSSSRMETKKHNIFQNIDRLSLDGYIRSTSIFRSET